MYHYQLLTNTPANTPRRADDPPLDFRGPHEREPRGDQVGLYRRALLLQRLVDVGLADPQDPEGSLATWDARVVLWLTKWDYGVVRTVADLLARAHTNGFRAGVVGARQHPSDLYRALDEMCDTWTSAADTFDDDRGPDGEHSEALRACVDDVQGVITRDVLRIEGAR